MKIDTYISSGILEQYAMGELPATQQAEVENMRVNHPEVSAELENIELTLERLAIKTAMAPRPELKSSIQAQLGLHKSEAKTIPMPSSDQAPVFNWGIAASVSIALLSSVMAFYFYGQWQSAEAQLDVLIAQNQEVADNYQFVNQRLQTLETDVEILANPNYRRIAMNGTDQAPDALATVYWNSKTNEAYLKIQQLKTLSQSEQYQLWAIVDGIPVDMGVFDSGDALLKMKSIASAAAFAVTIEPRGGSENPTLATMQVVGSTEV